MMAQLLQAHADGAQEKNRDGLESYMVADSHQYREQYGLAVIYLLLTAHPQSAKHYAIYIAVKEILSRMRLRSIRCISMRPRYHRNW